MANKWIQHVQAYAKKHGMKYNEAMKSAECKSAYNKKGAGIMDDGLNYVKNEGKKYIKGKAKELINKGAEYVKDNVIGGGLIRDGKMEKKGNGLFGNVLKTVGNAALDMAPIPGIARDVGKHIGNYAVNKSGLGIMKMKRKKYNNGGALYMA